MPFRVLLSLLATFSPLSYWDTRGTLDSGPLSSLNILRNSIGEEQARALIKIKHEKKMITLCGLKGDETELNLRGKLNDRAADGSWQIADAMMLAEEIKDMGSLSSLDISGNELNNGSRGMQELAPALAKSTTLTSLNVTNNNLGMNGGIEALVNVIPDMELLSNLHIGQNMLSGTREWQMRAIIAMDKFDILCAVPVKELKANSITELDLSGKFIGTEGALVLSTYLPEW
jgi:Ran GTPase-activating protein (RanGAP) involved in mRNA processing and transport